MPELDLNNFRNLLQKEKDELLLKAQEGLGRMFLLRKVFMNFL